jgi:diguanylate cyclase (GGDEF)-like protein/PAS domain S-box-containing protein
MTIDLRTMSVAMAATCLIVGATLSVMNIARFRRDGTLLWGMGWAFQGCFWLFTSLQGIVGDFLSVVVGSTCMVAGFSLFYSAVSRFRGRGYRRDMLLLPALVTFIVYSFFSVYRDNLVYRAVFASTLAVFQLGAVCVILFRGVPVQERRAYWLTGFAFLAALLMVVIRLSQLLFLPYDQIRLLVAAPLRNIGVIAGFVVVILSNMGFMLMIGGRAELALKESEQRWAATLSSIGDAVIATDKEGRVTFMNRVAEHLTGWSLGEADSRPVREVFRIASENAPHEETEHPAERVLREGANVSFSNRAILFGKDGTRLPIDNSGAPIRDGNGEVEGSVLVFRDVTERIGNEDALRWKTTFLEALVQSSQDGILVIDSRQERVAQNRRLVDMWHMPAEVAGTEDYEQCLDFLMSRIKNPESFYKKLIHLHNHPHDTVRAEFELDSGTSVEAFSYPVLGEGGAEQYGRIWMFRDISEIRRYWNMLESLSTTDGLTGISNRRRFDEFLEREWRRSMREYSDLSLLIVDIDYFKQFNDRYGHLEGDNCLKAVAAALEATLRRAGDLVARYGGEEFACILPRAGAKTAMKVAQKIVDDVAALGIPHEDSTAAGCVTVSVGVATEIPEKGRDHSGLIRRADRCLYAAKQQGRNRAVALLPDPALPL